MQLYSDMDKFVSRNISQPKRLKATIKIIDEIIKQYTGWTHMNQSNKTTAERMIKGLTSDNKPERGKAL